MFDFDEENSEEYSGNAGEVIDNLEDGMPADHEVSSEEYAVGVMNSAMQRIEEANLFKTLINQDIFAPNSARPEILNSVNEKIRQFAIKELEQLLGIRNHAEPLVVSSPFDDNEVAGIKMLLNNFTDVEVKVLKMLIGKVLKTDVAFVASNTPERKPELNTIKAPTPSINQVRTQPVAQPAQAPQKRTAPTPQPPAAGPQKPRRRKKMGLATPNAQTKVKPMPTPDQLMQVMGQPGVVASRATKGSAGVTEDVMNKGIMSVGDVVQRLTGGNLLAVDNSNPADIAMEGGGGVDVNGRF